MSREIKEQERLNQQIDLLKNRGYISKRKEFYLFVKWQCDRSSFWADHHIYPYIKWDNESTTKNGKRIYRYILVDNLIQQIEDILTRHNSNKPHFKPGYTYFAKHQPTGEEWHIIGIDEKKDRVCVAGWPASIAKLSDCCDFQLSHKITEKELNYRTQQFGEDWL